jgi:hypothetical protein
MSSAGAASGRFRVQRPRRGEPPQRHELAWAKDPRRQGALRAARRWRSSGARCALSRRSGRGGCCGRSVGRPQLSGPPRHHRRRSRPARRQTNPRHAGNPNEPEQPNEPERGAGPRPAYLPSGPAAPVAPCTNALFPGCRPNLRRPRAAGGIGASVPNEPEQPNAARPGQVEGCARPVRPGRRTNPMPVGSRMRAKDAARRDLVVIGSLPRVGPADRLLDRARQHGPQSTIAGRRRPGAPVRSATPKPAATVALSSARHIGAAKVNVFAGMAAPTSLD